MGWGFHQTNLLLAGSQELVTRGPCQGKHWVRLLKSWISVLFLLGSAVTVLMSMMDLQTDAPSCVNGALIFPDGRMGQ